MNEKMLGRPSMKTAEHCCGGAAEIAEPRASRSKAERRGTSQPMPKCRRRIPDNIGKEKNILYGADILICNKNRNLDLQRSEIKISKRKYVVTNEKQW